jgi:hypothetical protein
LIDVPPRRAVAAPGNTSSRKGMPLEMNGRGAETGRSMRTI